MAPTVTGPLGHTLSPRRRTALFAVVMSAILISSVDQSIVATALTAIGADLRSTIEWTSWTLSISALGHVSMLPIAGRLADRFGIKRVFLAAVAGFTLASVAASAATGIGMLIALRGLQAIAAGAFIPTIAGIITTRFGAARDRALGLTSSIFALGAVLGPALGGVLVTAGSWRWVFLVNVPIGAAVLVVGAALIPADESTRPKRLDIAGLVLLTAFLLGGMFSFTTLAGGSRHVPPWASIACAVAAGIALVGFVLRIRSTADPLLPPFLIWGRNFRLMNLLNFLVGSCAIGAATLVPVYAQERFGVSALEAGALLTVRALGLLVVTPLALATLRRFGYRLPMLVGFSAVILNLLGTALVPDVPPQLWLGLVGVVGGLGMGLAMPATNNAIMRLAPEHAASVAGLRSLFRQIGSMAIISGATAIASTAVVPGRALGVSYLVSAGLLALAVPLVLRVPDHRGTW